MADRSKRFRVWLAVLSCLAALPVARASPCFEQRSGPVTPACLAHVASIDGDVQALRSLGRRLEIAGRYKQASDIYRRALTHYRSDTVLQKGLIRVRSELRGRAILGEYERRPNDAARSRCWTLRWEAAAVACRDELAGNADDWALQERYGDVLRSIGRPSSALEAYRKSLDINNSNSRLRRKLDVLSELVDLEQAELTAADLPRLARAEPRPPVPSNDASASAGAEQIPAVPAGRYRAVIFGNQNYRDFESLDSPIADAKAIGQLLRDGYGFEVSTVIDATRYEIFDVLADLRRSSAGYDNVLIYYAGHGFIDPVTNRGYWLPIDAEQGNAANWISTSDITNLIAGLDSTHALVIADSCFSGALTRAAAADTFESRQALLRRLSARRSRQILTSGGLEPVLDGGNPFSRHSVFADALLDALRSNEGVIETGRLFVQVRDRVSGGSEQTPQYAPLRSAGHEGGDFIFVRRD